ncbi:MaoC/PaaZ C-terminal domain-containing protein [Pedococcus sp. KACC 23699]|uniref:MaoC/PaaZ C-terminal domain-containing protein n=1 Tax=Pedococcus sp. KACC 23699 TaxID=3149228 RepID=A0AAU7JSQ7_9MICO
MELREVSSVPALAPMFARAALTQRGRPGRDGHLPNHGLRLTGVDVDRGHLLDYQHLCRFAGGDVLPHTYPHVLGFPLQVQLMADRAFPLPLPGLVHLENHITVHRLLTADDRLDLTVHAADLRPHAKGTLVDLVTEVDVDGERVWEGRSTYLRRGRGDANAVAGQAPPALPDGPPVGLLRLPEGLGRSYAAVSGDVNPIHLHALSAKAMGFPRAIAHGMWTAARTLATLGTAASGPSTSTVWFRKPVLLPSTVQVVVDDSHDRHGLVDRHGRVVAGLRSGGDPVREHLVLTLET